MYNWGTKDNHYKDTLGEAVERGFNDPALRNALDNGVLRKLFHETMRFLGPRSDIPIIGF